MTEVCSPTSIFDLSTTCARIAWATLLPSFALLILILVSIPLPSSLVSVWSPFQSFLTLDEALALSASDDLAAASDANDTVVVTGNASVPLWRTLVLSWIGMTETLVWFALAINTFSISPSSPPAPSSFLASLPSLLISVTYFYTTLRPILAPRPTPAYDILILFATHFIGGTLVLGGIIFDYTVWGQKLPGRLILGAQVANLVLLTVGLGVILATPVGIVGGGVNKGDVVSLPSWMRF